MFKIRQRIGYLVLAVFLGHVILISAQVNVRQQGNVLQVVSFSALAGIDEILSSSANAVGAVWSRYVSLRDTEEENAVLRESIAQLELQLQQENALARQARSLYRLLELRNSTELVTLTAQVIAVDATPWFRTFTIDRGSGDGVRQDFAVIAPNGVVGRVVGTPGPRAAKVQLLIDRNAAAGALIERTRAAGVVTGVDGQSLLRMDYVSNLEDVRIGDAVVTSGTDGIYPKGFVIGTVRDVQRGEDLYKSILVDPVVEFGNLENVLIVLDDERLAQLEGVE
ncbi:MAG: rod shape-determining protein MreC [Acidobacteriota bacterium]|nr:rod shape-determining protein MreC [Acidobacteriota bacterium]